MIELVYAPRNYGRRAESYHPWKETGLRLDMLGIRDMGYGQVGPREYHINALIS